MAHLFRTGLVVVMVGFLFTAADCFAAGHSPDTTQLEREASRHLEDRNYDSAATLFNRAVNQLLKDMDTTALVRSAIGHSVALLRQRDYDQALEVLTTRLPFTPGQVRDAFMQAAWYRSIADVYYYKYDAFSALENYRHYYDYLKKNEPGSKELMDASRDMTIFHLNAGLMTLATRYAAEFKELAVKVEGEYSEPSADASNFLGMLGRYTGEPQVSLLNYEQALEIAEKLNKDGAGLPSNILLSNIGMLYMHELYQPELALDYFERSLVFLRNSGGDPYDLGQIHGKFARYYADKEQFESAYYHLDRSEAILRTADRAEMALYNALTLKADFYYQEGRYQEALAQLDEATRYRNEAIPGNAKFNRPTDYHKGRVWLALEQPDSALHYLHAALVSYLPDAAPGPHEVPSYSGDHPEKLMITRILQEKARAYEALAIAGDAPQRERAFTHYQGVLDWLYQIRSSYVYGESKTFISENMQEIIDEAMDTAVKQYIVTGERRYLEFIHHTIESNKWVELKEGWLMAQARMPDAFEASNQLEFLRKRKAYLEKQLAEALLPPADSMRLVAQRLNLEKEIRRISGQHRMLTENETVSLNEIQALLLKEDEVMSEFLLGKDRLHQLLITQDTVLYLTHENPKKLEEEVNFLRQSVRQGNPDDFSGPALVLYQRYVAPVMDLPGSPVRRQLVIPDGFINNLPFDALLTTSPENIQEFPASGYLIEKLATRKHFMVPSVPDNQTDKAILPGQVMAYSPNFTQENVQEVHERAGELINLPYAVEECQSLTSRFDGRFYQGTEATETSFKNTSGQASIIHLATHAIMEEDTPDRSRLLLYADSLNDGMLHSYEINALDIQSELVALSACNTGMGEYRAGEGNMSLARGFYLAGTRSVLMSLWTVDDHSTAGLMEKFYDYLDEGMAKDEALHQAKLDILKGADNIHRNPYYWAGFDLVGDTAPVTEEKSPWMIPALLAALVLIGAGFWWRRRRSVVSGE